MADERKFKFISPGISINEIDRSQIPAIPEAIGPVIIGRAQKGPSMVPVKVSSLAEFTSIFGDPEPGNQQLTDVWREGSKSATLYGAYAAKAYLTVGSTPITFMRLAGINTSDSNSGVRSRAGWNISQYSAFNSEAQSVDGAYGLFVLGSDSTSQNMTGTLGAIFYTSGSAIFPTNVDDSIKGMNTIVSGNALKEARLILSSSSGATKYRVSFDRNSPNFIRNVFNTNPQLIGSSRKDGTSVEDSSNIKKYWLGETFERTVKKEIIDRPFNTISYIMVPLVSGSSNSKADNRSSYREAQTPWVIKQDTSGNPGSYNPAEMDKLFKLVSLNGQGDYCSSNIKVSIDNIRYSVNENDVYSTFDVVVRDAKDNDVKQTVLERFSNLNLNPNSSDYIATRIGDQYVEFDSATEEVRVHGDRPNNSRYVRVVMSPYAQTNIKPQDVPFGFHGTVRPKSASIETNKTLQPNTYIKANGFLGPSATIVFGAGTHSESQTTASISFPSIPMRLSASSHATNHLNAYFGVDTNRSETVSVYNPGYIDYVRFLGSNLISSTVWGDSFGLGSAPSGLEYQYGFSLDELVVTTATGYDFSGSPKRNITDVTWVSGSRAGDTSWTTVDDGSTLPASASYKNIIDIGVNRFTMPMFGGFDGLNAFEREPLRNSYIQSGDSADTNYVQATYDRAINIISSPEFVEYNLASIPGLTNAGLTKKLMDVCQNRGDAMAVVDLPGGYDPAHESYQSTETARRGVLTDVYSSLDTRNLNNSYAAAYYPWVTIRDDRTAAFVKVPPSVVALGVLANTERVNDVWFAPAGFRRGGLSFGAAGYPVVSVDQKLTSTDRDDLYKRNVNPIASFPSEGIVIFGQKTLQAAPEASALSRINVRRLMIFLKKGISQIASTVLFEQNVQATWNDFKTRADNFLSGVKVRFGLDDYRVVLDETTTTPDLIDRNILYAQVYVKPTRSIEFVALDFIITRSGASFDD